MKSNQLIYDGLIHPDFSNAELLNKTIDYLKKNYNVQGALAVPLPGQDHGGQGALHHESESAREL